LIGVLSTPISASVVFFSTPAEFATVLDSLTLMGTEDWSSASDAPAQLIDDPLLPGVAKGPFPNGSSVDAGVTVQSNSLGDNPTNAPGGSLMYYAPAGFVGWSGNVQPSEQLGASFGGHGFDLILSEVGGNTPVAVEFSPMFYLLNGFTNSASVTIRVFSPSNGFLGSTTVPNVEDCLEDAYVGILTTDGDSLGRVNIWATSTDVSGADNIAVYSGTPVPVLDYEPLAGGFQLTWPFGTLLESTTILGPWTTNGNTSPYIVSPDPLVGQMFFRVKSP